MVTTKLLEIRDKSTFIPVYALCLKTNSPASNYLMRRVGYNIARDPSDVILGRLCGGYVSTTDYNFWGDRTFTVAHEYIVHHWDELSDGDVVDVEFILGETKVKKVSERFSVPE